MAWLLSSGIVVAVCALGIGCRIARTRARRRERKALLLSVERWCGE
jgi:hypothetical protein